jgi:CubicO group peptidase (beta-lactamase class C family)
VLPAGWTKEASSPKTLKGGKPLEYGCMWCTGWSDATKKDNALSAVGIQGQYVYTNPAHTMAIAQSGAKPKPAGKDAIDPMASFDAIFTTLK